MVDLWSRWLTDSEFFKTVSPCQWYKSQHHDRLFFINQSISIDQLINQSIESIVQHTYTQSACITKCNERPKGITSKIDCEQNYGYIFNIQTTSTYNMDDVKTTLTNYQQLKKF